MGPEGYVIDAKDIKMTGGAPFVRATRYKRPDEMVFHVWRHSEDVRELALIHTSLRAGYQFQRQGLGRTGNHSTASYDCACR
jgi:hypothetical protein